MPSSLKPTPTIDPTRPREPLVYLTPQYIRAKEYLEAIVDSTSDAICTTDVKGRIIYFSPGAERMLGRRASDMVGRGAHTLYEGGRKQAEQVMRTLIDRGKLANVETVLVAADGRKVSVSMSLALLRDKAGSLIGTLGISKDITERVELERRLRELSIRDELTGLFNRRHFQERFEAEMRRAKRQRTELSVILMDLDSFKTVNDRYGHLEGDRMLRRVSAAIQRSIRDGVDAAFRYGGDEFVILVPGLDSSKAAMVDDRVNEAFHSKLKECKVTFSSGVVSLRHNDTPESLLRRADSQMYQAKNAKRQF